LSAQIVEWLRALVSFDTQNPPGRESEAVEWLARTLETFGCKVWTEEALAGRPNVIAELRNGDGKTFAFNSHVDVVPVGDGWASDPFGLREKDGRFYGRGACDAKGPIAAMLDAVRALCDDRRAWRGTLRAVFVADEETESRGAKAYAKNSPHIDYAVIGEPTSNGIVTAHKGSLRPIVAVTGAAAHSGTPELGVNAIYAAAKLCALVEREHAEVVSRRRHPLCGAAAMSVTRIRGGHADNIIPERCELMIDRRMIPGEDEEAVKREIAQLVERSGVKAEIIAWQPTTGGPTETESSQPIVQAALRAAAAHGVARPGPGGFQGGCDLVHFRKTGAQGVVVGPGTLAVAHKPDEFVPADELFAASLIYRDVALAMLQ
jgi:acetylornithine deacetylase/succinyl-diaminopimelate desuccinylase family protein